MTLLRQHGLRRSSGGGAGISLSNVQVNNQEAAGVTIGSIAQPGSGSWAYALVSGHTAGGRVALSGSNLQTTSTPFAYNTQSSYDVRIQATRTSPYMQIVQDVTIYVRPPLTGQTTPDGIADFSDPNQSGLAAAIL